MNYDVCLEPIVLHVTESLSGGKNSNKNNYGNMLCKECYQLSTVFSFFLFSNTVCVYRLYSIVYLYVFLFGSVP